MERNDLTLIAESYQDVKLNSYINRLIEEGKTEEEIKDILVQEGLWDQAKAKWAGFDPKKIGTSLKGKLGQLGQKALDSNVVQGASKFAQKAAGAGQKAVQKAGFKGSALDKGLGGVKKFAKNAPVDARKALDPSVQKGKTAESSMRAEKFKSIVSSHKRHIFDLFNKSVAAKTQTMEGLNELVDEMMNDYKNVGGVTNIQGLEQNIKNDVVQKIMQMPYLNFTNPQGMADMFVKEILNHINNKVKTNAGAGTGLEKAHKLQQSDIY
jgi:hypothetical protein